MGIGEKPGDYGIAVACSVAQSHTDGSEWLDPEDTGQALHITCSIGVATHTGDMFARPNLLVKAADQGVYAAKAAGRNCVRVWSATGVAEKVPA